MKILILVVLVATDLAAAGPFLGPASSPFPPAPRSEPFLPPPGGAPPMPPAGGASVMPPPGGAPAMPPPGVPPFLSLPGMLPPVGSPFPMPPGFPNLALALNCTQNTDCSGDLKCCWLPCGRKCIPLVPDITRPDGPKVCPEEILKKLNISDQLHGLPDPSSIKNCSQPAECAKNLKCCQSPYGGKCIPTISYNSSTESIINMCPMEFFMKLFTPMHQPGSPMMPGPGDHPHPSGGSHPCSMDHIAEQVNAEITGIAAEIKRQVPERSKEVENVKNRIQDKVKEAFHHIQEKVEDGLEALETISELLEDNKIPRSKISGILSNVGKACPAGIKEGPWNVIQRIDTVLTALKTLQSTLPKSSRP